MNKNNIITVGLIIAGLFVGYLLGSNSTLLETGQQSGNINVPSVSLVNEWSGGVTGDVVEINSDAITISSNEQTLVISLADDLLVSRVVVIGNEAQEPMEGLSLDDIEAGNMVGLNVIVDKEGNVRTNRISLFEIQL